VRPEHIKRGCTTSAGPSAWRAESAPGGRRLQDIEEARATAKARGTRQQSATQRKLAQQRARLAKIDGACVRAVQVEVGRDH
jgi:hypothetical protein